MGEKLRVLDLFSGIGGFSLGLERTGGFETVAFCEIEPFPRRVLAKHWPNVPIYEDVRILTAERLAADGISVDVICGGFPCQDISLAGKAVGIEGERSSLWAEYARLIGEIGPRFVIVENVAALLGRGLDKVLRDMASIGYDAQWHCIPASAVGAPHRRDRIWIVAYPGSEQHEGDGAALRRALAAKLLGAPADAYGDGQPRREECHVWQEARVEASRGDDALRRNPRRASEDWWAAEPEVGRVAHGVPARVDRLRALGNAVVPQIPEMIGHAILAAQEPSP